MKCTTRSASSSLIDLQKEPALWSPCPLLFSQRHGFMLLEFSIKAAGLIVPLLLLLLRATRERLAALRAPEHKRIT